MNGLDTGQSSGGCRERIEAGHWPDAPLYLVLVLVSRALAHVAIVWCEGNEFVFTVGRRTPIFVMRITVGAVDMSHRHVRAA